MQDIAPVFGGAVTRYRWTVQGCNLTVGYEQRGEGPPLLLLPALSTVSSRSEWSALVERLSDRYRCIAVDWPGFGDSDRPPLDYGPDLLRQFLQDFVRDCCPPELSVVAAGHAAAYALAIASACPQPWRQLMLVAPTWRGLLPTMLQRPASTFKPLQQMVRLPGLGGLLYHLNTSRAVLGYMYRRHVLRDEQRLTPEFLRRKQAIARQPGARFASVAFVTGGLDVYGQSDAWLESARQLHCPLTVVLAQDSPPRSRWEMEQLAQLPGVRVAQLPGRLGLHEETVAQLAALLAPGAASTERLSRS